MNDPTPTETIRTHYQARDAELREAALLAFAGAGYRVGKAPGTKPNLTVWHTRDDGPTVAEMAERYNLQPST
jgi:hypothetical protein